jgi:membrane-associated phospholipid phosphatase
MFRPSKHTAMLILGMFLLMSKPVLATDDGSFMRTLIPAVAYGTTFYMHDKDGRIQFYKSFFTNLGATYALKALISEERPNGEDDDSFPSGHTSVAFQGAAFIHRRYGLKWALPAYVGAVYVGWRRVDTDNHYTKDVVAGAAIGIASSFIFTKPYHGFEVTPLADNGVYGLAISKHW